MHGGPDIQYNVEHTYKENGKMVRKMPIKLGNGQTIWSDCVDLNQEEMNQQNRLIQLHAVSKIELIKNYIAPIYKKKNNIKYQLL